MSNQSDVKQLLDKHNHTSLQNQQVGNIIDIFMDRDNFDLCIFPVDDQLQPIVVTDLLCTDSMRKLHRKISHELCHYKRDPKWEEELSKEFISQFEDEMFVSLD